MQNRMFSKKNLTWVLKFSRDTFLTDTLVKLTAELGKKVNCFIGVNDSQMVKIVYPNSFSDSYILQEIRLEIGALALGFQNRSKYYSLFGETNGATLILTNLSQNAEPLGGTYINRCWFKITKHNFKGEIQ